MDDVDYDEDFEEADEEAAMAGRGGCWPREKPWVLSSKIWGLGTKTMGNWSVSALKYDRYGDVVEKWWLLDGWLNLHGLKN